MSRFWAAVVLSIVFAACSFGAGGNPVTALFSGYCLGCHNGRVKTAGLVLDRLDTTNMPASAEIWEKVAWKLRTGTMPPPGLPRPQRSASDAVAIQIETALDRAAAAHPNPGRTEALHRLNRSEYHNVIREPPLARHRCCISVACGRLQLRIRQYGWSPEDFAGSDGAIHIGSSENKPRGPRIPADFSG